MAFENAHVSTERIYYKEEKLGWTGKLRICGVIWWLSAGDSTTRVFILKKLRRAKCFLHLHCLIRFQRTSTFYKRNQEGHKDSKAGIHCLDVCSVYTSFMINFNSLRLAQPNVFTLCSAKIRSLPQSKMRPSGEQFLINSLYGKCLLLDQKS